MIGITRLLCGVAGPGDDLRYRESVHGRPVVVWNLTHRCNLHCLHCYAQAQDRASPQELTTEEGISVIDDLAQFGVPVLLFSGGEPLLRPDLLQLAAHATQRGIRAVVSSNGTLITPSLAREMKSAGIAYVGVSLDGLEDINDRFRGKRGAFQEALDGLRHCRHVGLRAGLRFTITSYNFREIEGIFQLVEDEDIPRLCFYHLVYAGRGSQLVAADLSAEETRGAVDLIFHRTLDLCRRGKAREILTVDNHADGVYLYLRVKGENPGRAEQVYRFLQWNGGNSSGVGIAAIDHLGEVHPDQFWRHYSLGNVRQRKFSQIWQDSSDPLIQGLRNRKAMLRGRCALCRYLEVCGGNFRVRAEAVYGDTWAPDPACYLSDQEIGIAS